MQQNSWTLIVIAVIKVVHIKTQTLIQRSIEIKTQTLIYHLFKICHGYIL